MPVTPSVSGFPSNPLGQIWLEGAAQGDRVREVRLNAQLEREKMGNQYAIAEMETATRRQQLQQQAQQAQMELEANQQALQQQMAMKSQELNFDKAYRDAQIGLGEQEAKLNQQGMDFKIRQAADITSSRMKMRQEFDQLKAMGLSDDEASRTAIMRQGAGADLPGGAWSDVIAGGGRGAGATIPEGIEFGKMYDVQGQPGYKYGRTGPNSVQFFEPPKDPRIAAVPFDSTKGVYGSRVMDRPEERKAMALEKDANARKRDLISDKFELHRRTIEKAKDPKATLTAGDKNRIKEYEDQKAEITRMLKEVDELRKWMRQNPIGSAGSTNATSGVRTYDPVTRKFSQ